MKKLLVILSLVLALTACQDEVKPSQPAPEQPQDEVTVADETEPLGLPLTLEAIPAFMEQMTLEEKAGQLIQAEFQGIQYADVSGYNIGSILSGGGSVPKNNSPAGWVELYNRMQRVAGNSSTGLPILYGIDAVHGHNNVNGAVIFPHNIGLGAANDPELMSRIGQVVALELKATGLNWNFAPAVSIIKDLRWGRTYESFSEDPDRVTDLAGPYMVAMEEEGIITTTKHFLGDGYTAFGTGESNQLLDRGDVTMTKEALYAAYLPVYQAMIDQGTSTIMASFNSIHGQKVHGSKEVLTDLLRGELGFEGLVVSDWEAIHALPGSLQDQVVLSINAGVDMLMQPYNWREVRDAIVAGVEGNRISVERLDEAVERVLTLKVKVGLTAALPQAEVGEIGLEDHRQVAREAVAKSLVLLKNDKDLLPLAKETKVYLMGPAADNVGIQSGGWTLTWQGTMDQASEGGTSIKEAFAEVGSLVESPEEADVIVLAIGEKPYAEMMGDVTSLSLASPVALSENLSAIEAARTSGKPIVTLLVAGRPLLVEDYLDQWDSLVMTWLPGTEAKGITDVLYGDKPFMGTLPVTWPKDDDQAAVTILDEDYDAANYQFPYGFGILK